MSKRVLLGCVFFCVVSSLGCSNAHEADVDSGFVVQDGWVIDSAGEWCGSVQCGVGTACCNASCGICTPPGVGCVALACEDGGMPMQGCGGLTPNPCPPGEYCDFPDGSFCGGDDDEGVCRPRPTDCPDPGGNRVCGCDGMDYVGDCSAYHAGTDVAHPGPCEMPPPPSSQASATRLCGPTDGPQWNFVITSGFALCVPPAVASTTITITRGLSIIQSPLVLTIGPGGDGSAVVCPYGVGGPPCFDLTGTMTIDSFDAGVMGTFSYALHAADGTAYSNANVNIGTWCGGTPVCG